MIKRRFWVAIAALAITALAFPLSASAEEAAANKTPWSGYWWPMLSSETNLYDNNGPLAKYDAYLAAVGGSRGNAQDWERANHATNDSRNSWWGHCHAWAAASILTRQPAYNFTKGGQYWTTNDTKGLVTELYYAPKYSGMWGHRVDDPNDRSSAYYQDINPAWMDALLRYYIYRYHYPFVMDISAGSEVWNFPAFAYRRTSLGVSNGVESVRTTVWFSSPDYNTTGVRYISRTYTYQVWNAGGGMTGRWTGNSVSDHPDFAWAPNGKTNPSHINAGWVSNIIGQQV